MTRYVKNEPLDEWRSHLDIDDKLVTFHPECALRATPRVFVSALEGKEES